MSITVLIYYPYKILPAPLMAHIISAASTALTLLKEEPLIATLHFLRDFLAYGGEDSPFSSYGDASRQNPPQIQGSVKRIVLDQGEVMVQRCMTGMMYSFPRDCLPDASGVLLAMFQLVPEQVASWVGNTVGMLPPGSISPQEQERLLNNINQ